MGIVSPWIRFDSSAAKPNVSTDRATSPMEYFQALPASRQMIVAISSCRAARISAVFARIRARLWAGYSE